MNGFTALSEHYCPYIGKNIVLKKEVFENENLKDGGEKYTCLNSHECLCGEKCKNGLFNMEVNLK